MIKTKHKTAIKITSSTIKGSTDRKSNMCIFILIFYFLIFVLGVTPGNEDATSVKDFVYFCIWFKSREFRGRLSPRFRCVTSAVESFSL